MELNYDRLVQQTESWLPIVLEYSGKVALALLTLAIGWWLINTLTGRVGGLLARRSVDRTLQGFVGSLVSIVLKILLVVSVASMIGIQTTSFVAAIGAAGLAIGLTRRRFNRWGPKSLLLAGMAIQAGGLLWLARSGEGSGFWQLAGAYATMGFGGSLCSSAAQGMALLDVPAARMGHASALWNINRQLAFCLGMAVLGGLLNLLQARADPAAFVHCFLFAAAFTLLPLPWVRRIDSAGVRALVQT